jgi:hypothetical protein
MARWESNVLADMPDGKHPADPALLGEFQSASGYMET